MATIAIVQHRTAVDAAVVHDQLAAALQSRIVIEQAKGIIAERQHLELDEAFARLRSYARNHNRRLSDVAHAVVHRSLSLTTPDTPRARRRS